MEALLLLGAIAIGAEMVDMSKTNEQKIAQTFDGQYVSNTYVQPESEVVWVFENE